MSLTAALKDEQETYVNIHAFKRGSASGDEGLRSVRNSDYVLLTQNIGHGIPICELTFAQAMLDAVSFRVLAWGKKAFKHTLCLSRVENMVLTKLATYPQGYI